MLEKDHLIFFPDKGITEKLLVFPDEFTLKNIPRGSKVLEIGCGVGHFAQKIEKRARSVVEIDLSAEDIEKARRTNINKKISFHVMDGQDLRFEPETFDVVVSRFVFHHLNQEAAAESISRVLKKGGKLIVIDIIREFFYPYNRALLLLNAVVKLGLFKMIEMAPKLGYFFTGERIEHTKEDLKKLRSLRIADVRDFRTAYLKHYPGARIGRIFCAAYLLWTKP